jgi:hypothetical protein
VVRGATFACGLPIVVVVDLPTVVVVEVLVDALLLELEPHPAKPRLKATTAIATPLIAAVRFMT